MPQKAKPIRKVRPAKLALEIADWGELKKKVKEIKKRKKGYYRRSEKGS